MSVKVIAGWCHGLTLKSPKQSHTRPTSSRVREAIWSSLVSRVEVVNMIDFFAGTGAMGIEAVSRGARSCCFVENHPTTIPVLRQNIKLVEHRAEQQSKEIELNLLAMSFEQALRRLQKLPQHYDLLWMDPPYNMVMELLRTHTDQCAALLKRGGYWLLESDRRDKDAVVSLVGQTSELCLETQKVYGDTAVTYLYKD